MQRNPKRPGSPEGMQVDKAINWAGHGAAYLGVFVCTATSIARVLGNYSVAGFSVLSGFELGVGLMVFACLAKLHLLNARINNA